jgi:hypothetical protein
MINHKRTFNYKDMSLDFNWHKMPACDQEYLRTMIAETVNSISVKATGKSFKEMYPDASNFAMFLHIHNKDRYQSEFALPTAETVSHLLNGQKYWLTWTYQG